MSELEKELTQAQGEDPEAAKETVEGAEAKAEKTDESPTEQASGQAPGEEETALEEAEEAEDDE